MDDATKRRLLIKGFPEWIKAEDKDSLLRHFGATDVVVMPTKGRMVSCAVGDSIILYLMHHCGVLLHVRACTLSLEQ